MTRPFGAHWLAFLGTLGTGDGHQLTEAVRIAAEEGCVLFELACHPINGMCAPETAAAVLAGGIKEVSYCRFFPTDETLGDPLGDGDELNRASQTFYNDLVYIEELRLHGLTVRFITGPSCFVLGKTYDFPGDERHRRLLRFVANQAAMVNDRDLTICLEYLRPGEDKGAIGGIDNMVRLIDDVNNRSIRFHADVFHMLQCGEDPWMVLNYARYRTAYLHAHGSRRIVPGAYCLDDLKDATDTVNWHLIGRVLNAIGYCGPVVPEPFGATIREQIPALGEGLPPAINSRRYYHLAAEHLQHVGIL